MNVDEKQLRLPTRGSRLTSTVQKSVDVLHLLAQLLFSLFLIAVINDPSFSNNRSDQIKGNPVFARVPGGLRTVRLLEALYQLFIRAEPL